VLVAVSLMFGETARPAAASAWTGYVDAFTNLTRVVTDRRLRPFHLSSFILYPALFGFFRVYPMHLVDEFGLDVGEVSK
jgi:hypothetical protein